MKKILLIAAFGVFSLLSSYLVTAQTFSTEADTIYVTAGNAGTYYNHITNLTAQPINIRWSATTDFTGAWLTGLGICDADYCYSDLGPHTTNDTPYKPNVPGILDMQLSNFASVTPGVHYVTLSLRDMTSPSGTSKNVTFIVNKFPTNVAKTTKADDEITLYPNPARNELNVLFSPDAGVKIISVYNLIGKAVTVYKLSSNSSAMLDIENLPQGIYFIRLIDGQGQVVATRKFTHQ